MYSPVDDFMEPSRAIWIFNIIIIIIISYRAICNITIVQISMAIE